MEGSSLTDGSLETVALLKVSEMLGASLMEGTSTVIFSLSLTLGAALSLPEEKEGRSHHVKKRQDNKIRICFFILFFPM